MCTASLTMLFIAVLDGILDFATGITRRLIEDLTLSSASTTVKKITSITQEVRCGTLLPAYLYSIYAYYASIT